MAKGKGNKAPARFEKPEPVAPEVRRGTSTCDNPVGVTWVTCIVVTHANGGELLARREYIKAAREQGVTYYTARTQVHKFLQWHNGGRDPEALPRGVVLEEA